MESKPNWDRAKKGLAEILVLLLICRRLMVPCALLICGVAVGG